MAILGRPAETSAVNTDTAPCVGCGLCCDGTIYAQARAQPHELERMSALGLTVSETDEGTFFALPCRHAAGGQCTIYDRRFSKCRSFRCKLLKAYQAGEVGLDEAKARVDGALKLRSAVAAEEPSAARMSERQRLWAAPELRKSRPQLFIRMLALDHCLDSWFRNKDPMLREADAMARPLSGKLAQDPFVNP